MWLKWGALRTSGSMTGRCCAINPVAQEFPFSAAPESGAPQHQRHSLHGGMAMEQTRRRIGTWPRAMAALPLVLALLVSAVRPAMASDGALEREQLAALARHRRKMLERDVAGAFRVIQAAIGVFLDDDGGGIAFGGLGHGFRSGRK